MIQIQMKPERLNTALIKTQYAMMQGPKGGKSLRIYDSSEHMFWEKRVNFIMNVLAFMISLKQCTYDRDKIEIPKASKQKKFWCVG